MQVILYTKRHCQLCDALKFELLDLQGEYGFGLREHFVEDDPVLQDQAGHRVPFVELERHDRTTVSFAFPVKQAELRRCIHAEMKRQAAGGRS